MALAELVEGELAEVGPKTFRDISSALTSVFVDCSGNSAENPLRLAGSSLRLPDTHIDGPPSRRASHRPRTPAIATLDADWSIR
ncbi:hypothetical protein ACWER9_01275 [Micromonospora sp. NPDC003944]